MRMISFRLTHICLCFGADQHVEIKMNFCCFLRWNSRIYFYFTHSLTHGRKSIFVMHKLLQYTHERILYIKNKYPWTCERSEHTRKIFVGLKKAADDFVWTLFINFVLCICFLVCRERKIKTLKLNQLSFVEK